MFYAGCVLLLCNSHQPDYQINYRDYATQRDCVMTAPWPLPVNYELPRDSSYFQIVYERAFPYSSQNPNTIYCLFTYMDNYTSTQPFNSSRA